jgi:hypothetical protein
MGCWSPTAIASPPPQKKKTKENKTNLIFFNQAGMGEVTIPPILAFFIFTTIMNDGAVTEYITYFHYKQTMVIVNKMGEAHPTHLLYSELA